MQLSRTVTVQKDTRHYHVDSHHGTRHPAVCESGACRCCRELVALIGPRASIARPPVRLDCVRLASENRRRAQRRLLGECLHAFTFSFFLTEQAAPSSLLPAKRTERPRVDQNGAPSSHLPATCVARWHSTVHRIGNTQNDHCITSTIAISHTQPPGSCEYSTTSV